MQYLVTTIALLIFLSLVSISDLAFNKINNWLTCSFAIVGIAINVYFFGIWGLAYSILGLSVGFALLLLPFILGWLGGGDVKMLASAGSIIGPNLIAYSTLLGLILFGIFAAFYLLAKGKLKSFIFNLYRIIFSWDNINGINSIQVTGNLPMGLFLSSGIILTWFEIIRF